MKNAGPERLQKVLAAAGVASRRECEQWILDGRIEIDRKVVTKLGVRVDPQSQEIRVDGQPLKQPKRRYFMLNKPDGVVTTNRDPQGRPRVVDLIPSDQRLFPVGRLDRTSEGLILVTNDGEWANQLAHPKFGIEKTYLATVVGRPSQEQLDQLEQGVYFAEGKARVVSARVKKRMKEQTVLEIVLDEGRNREIRRLLAKVGHKVVRLRRIAIGTVRLGDLPTGAHRELTPYEIRSLRRLVRSGGQRPQEKSAASTSRTRKPSGPRKSQRVSGGSSSRRAAKTAPRGKKKSGSARTREALAAPVTGAVIGGEPSVQDAERTTRKKKSGRTAAAASGARRKKRSTKAGAGKAKRGRKSR